MTVSYMVQLNKNMMLDIKITVTTFERLFEKGMYCAK